MKKGYILIVEDTPSYAKSVVHLIHKHGHRLDHVTSGEGAISLATNHDYDLILMDIGLPDVSGISVTKTIRQLNHSSRSQVPIIALTAYSDMRAKCLGAGMQNIIEKPSSALQINYILDRYLNNRRVSNGPSGQSKKDNHCPVTEAVFLDLQAKQTELIHAYKLNDQSRLRSILHHMKGGVCYINQPQLMQAIDELHIATKLFFQDKEHLELAFRKAQESIHAFFTSCEHSFFETVSS